MILLRNWRLALVAVAVLLMILMATPFVWQAKVVFVMLFALAMLTALAFTALFASTSRRQ